MTVSMRQMAGLLVLTLCAGCTTAVKYPPMPRHSVIVDGTGSARDPANHDRLLAEEAYKASLLETEAQIVSWHQRTGHTNVVLFLHGGLNGWNGSDRRVAQLTPLMLADGTYPIFVNWDSSLGSTYWEHLLWMRQGRIWPVLGPITSPFVLVADVGRSISRAPLSWYYQYTLLRKGVSERNSSRFTGADLVAQLAAMNRVDPAAPQACHANPVAASTSSAADHARGFLSFLPGLVSTPLALDGLGTGAWGSMLRRTDVMFHRERSRNGSDTLGAGDQPSLGAADGAVAVLAESLVDLRSRAPKLHISIIGHSMGAIVGNSLVGKYGEQIRPDEVVFMAAACTVEDFCRDVAPYLHRNPGSRFYNLMLHPRCDAEETHLWGLGGGGSLLEQIDYLYASPNSPLERTLGKWENIMMAYRAIDPAVRSQIYLKTFPYGDDRFPQRHGEFDSKGAFWQMAWWDPCSTPDEALATPGPEILDP